MKRRALWTTLAVLAAGGASAPLWAPPLLTRVRWFDARQIEVSGTRLLAPHEVLQASGVSPGVSIWTDPAPWEAALRRHPAVAEAEVTRSLPATLRIRVVERPAVALMQDGVLRPATADGTVLPVSLAQVPVDLPLLRAPAGSLRNGRVVSPAVRDALAGLGNLARLDPALLARTSEVRVEANGVMRLSLGSPEVEILLPATADTARLLRLRAALADVARRMHADSSRVTPRVDARWEDQIVVRMTPGRS